MLVRGRNTGTGQRRKPRSVRMGRRVKPGAAPALPKSRRGLEVHVVEKEEKMTAQDQAKVLQQSLVSQQNVIKLPDSEQVPVDGAATAIEDIVLATLDILQNSIGLRNAFLFQALDINNARSYISDVREPCLMPSVGWER